MRFFALAKFRQNKISILQKKISPREQRNLCYSTKVRWRFNEIRSELSSNFPENKGQNSANFAFTYSA